MNTETVEQIRVEDIIPNRFQPRLTFNEKELQELADSIKVHGVIQPLVLRKVGNKYEIIAGERRYKASCIAGLKSVPAIVRNLTDNESAEIALIENMQRKNLTSIEEAQSFKNLLNRGYTTQDKLAENLGVTQSTISNKLRLLNLCDEVQNALLNNKISERHARSLLVLEDPNEQKVMLERILKERLTVKQLDNELRKLKKSDARVDEISNNENHQEEKEIKTTESEPSKEEVKGEMTMRESKPNNNYFGFQTNNEINDTRLEEKSNENETTDEISNNNINEENKEKENTPSTNESDQIGFNPFSNGGNKFFTYNFENDSNQYINNVEPQTQIEEKIDKPEDKTEETGEKFELFDIFGDEIKQVEEEISNDPDAPKKQSLGDQINKIREAVKDIEQNDFHIEMEEYDLEDIYQINIKIKKTRDENE